MRYGESNGHLTTNQWHYVTPIGQGRDPNMFGAQYYYYCYYTRFKHVRSFTKVKNLKWSQSQYLENGWRYRLVFNGAPMGNDYLGIKRLRDRWRHVTQKGQGRVPNMGPLSRKWLEVQNWWQWKWGMASRMVTWPVTPRERSRSWLQLCLVCQYLENGW